jgi:maltose-binding protein MalE
LASSVNNFKYDDNFYKLPQFIEDGAFYIDRLMISNEQIYIKGCQDLQIIKLDKIRVQTCRNDPEQIQMNKFLTIIIHRVALIMGRSVSDSNPKLNE